MHETPLAVCWHCLLYTSTLAELETQVAASPYFAAMIATCPCDLLVKIISLDDVLVSFHATHRLPLTYNPGLLLHS